MAVNSGTPTPYIDLSKDNLLLGLNQEVSTSELEEGQPQPIAITNIQSLTMEVQPLEIKNSPAPERLKCPECTRYTAVDEEHMARHIRKAHRGENPFQCFMCDYSTYNKTVFEEHVRIHKGIKPYQCSYCPHRNVSKKNLKRHERIHRPDNPLKCPHCDYIGKNQICFNSHTKKYHPKYYHELKCKWCAKKFPDEKTLLAHKSHVSTCKMLVDENNTDSEICGFTICSSYKMKYHKQNEHGVDPKLRKDWKCALCDWSCHQKSRILLHLIHHPNQMVDENDIDVSILRKYGIM
ncbi:transcriptional repressor CTCF-like [Maniola hyperantus]|uniref:transcriptional repressor CTCF-like n=1 Tax=Aphantopus hyperantus TaxID=2795564 RepID=UPI00212A51F2